MKWRALLLGAGLLCAQDVELVPLTPTETMNLKRLMAEVDRTNVIQQQAYKANEQAWGKFCAEAAAIKKARKTNETSGSCGSSAWTSEMSSGSGLLGGRSRWDFDKDFKFLVHAR